MIDPEDHVDESNELNNIGSWPLAVDELDEFPYINDFNQEIIDGWKPYSSDFNEDLGQRHRMRHRTAPGEDVQSSLRRTGEWFTDQIDSYCADESSRPVWYLESPSFVLNGEEEVYINFNLYNISAAEEVDGYSDGSNLEYSIDGGNSWKVLGYANDNYGTNWFNSSNMDFFAGQHGWTGIRDFYEPVNYDASAILGGEENVVFRTKFSSNYSPFGCEEKQGFRIDNFVLSTDAPTFVDYQALNQCDTIDLTSSGPNFSLNFMVHNAGSQISGESITNFYWSSDQTIDDADYLVSEYRQLNIGPLQTINFFHILPTPDSSCDSLLYLLYEIDSALPGRPQGVAIEPNEENNKGCFTVLLDSQSAPVSPEIAVSNIPNLCYGEPATLSAQNGLVYEWSTGETENQIQVYEPGMYSLALYNELGCYLGTDSVEVSYEFLPSLEISEDGQLGICEGESLLVDASIENPVSYSWSTGHDGPTLTLEEAGEYEVAVTNNYGCTATETFYLTVDSPTEANIDIIGDLPFCEGDTVVLSSNHSLGNFWSTGEQTEQIIVTSGGTYNLSHQNFCGNYTDFVNLDTFEAPDTSITVNGDLNLCEGESVTITAMPNYEYSWSTGEDTQSIEVTGTQILDLTVTNSNGCSLSTEPIIVQEQPIPDAFIDAAAGLLLCEGGELLLSGPTSTTNLWSNGEEGAGLVVTQPGEYSLISFTEFGCSDTSEVIDIQQVPSPAVPVISFNDNQLSTDAVADNYQWYYNGLPLYLFNEAEAPVSISGEYSVLVINEFGCTASSEVYPFGLTAIESTPDFKVKLHPNPSTDVSTIHIDGSGLQNFLVEVYDLPGRKLAELPTTGDLQISAEKLKLVKGAYLVKISRAEMSIFVKWIVSR